MSNLKPEDVVLVYKDTPTFEDGMIGQIIDKDPNDGSYLVADLRDIGKADRDIGVILERYGKWVKPEHMCKLEFEKQSSFSVLPYIIGSILGGGLVLGILAYDYLGPFL